MIESEDKESVNQLHQDLLALKFITEETIEDIVFEPVDWNKKVLSKKRWNISLKTVIHTVVP